MRHPYVAARVWALYCRGRAGYLPAFRQPSCIAMFIDRDENHYQVLGVSPTAGPDAIRAAYRHMARLTHPDVQCGGGRPAFDRVLRAYEVLSNPCSRLRYDTIMGLGERPPSARGDVFAGLFDGVFGGLRATMQKAEAEFRAFHARAR
jgi:curved DNA-binding protein CbpA